MKRILDLFHIMENDISLYEAAFTHTSYSNEYPECDNYERLEFLGDAVLEIVISEYLYKEKHIDEGLMTKMRASYVCELACATYAKDLGFHECIRLGSGESEANETILADVFEAFIGACYLDQGFNFVKKLVLDIIIKYIDNKADFLHDYKSELQELVQTVKKSVVYEVVDEQGPAHNKTFTSIVLVDGIYMGKGVGGSKKSAEQMAAKEALSKQVQEM